MNIDECLERLKERQDALARTVEAMRKDSDRHSAEACGRSTEIDIRLGQVVEEITQLGRKAQARAHRPDNLEDRPH